MRTRPMGLGLTLASVCALAIALLTSGCSTDRKDYNPRMGLLDILAGMEPAHHWSGGRSAGRGGDYAVEDDGRAFPIPPRGQNRAPASLSPEKREQARAALEWPLRSVQITSPFGRRGREFHEGVDLRAKPGTPVYAAHAGQVLYSGERIRGYGEMVVLRHSSGLATIYAHNSRLVVHRGEWVHQGELIAYTGSTGDARGPHLHFEVREGVNAVDPLSLLPRPGSQARERALALR